MSLLYKIYAGNNASFMRYPIFGKYVAQSATYEVEWKWPEGDIRIWDLTAQPNTLLFVFSSMSFDFRAIAKMEDPTKPIAEWSIEYSSARMIDAWVEKILKMKAFV